MSDRSNVDGGSVGNKGAPRIVDGVPERCLVCTVSGDWGHFRRIDRTVTKQTYLIPPRTTIAGLLAAIVGVGRDEYYESFTAERSAIGLEVLSDLRTTTQPTLGLGTNPSETYDRAGGTGRKTVQVEFPDSTDNRQIHSYEYIVRPSYRLYVATEDQRFYERLRTHLRRGTSYYTPTLGLSELLVNVTVPEWTDNGEISVDSITTDHDEDQLTIRSTLPDATEAVIPQQGNTHHVERLPAFMERDGNGRRTTRFVDHAFSDDSDLRVTRAALETVPMGRVDGRVIAFN